MTVRTADHLLKILPLHIRFEINLCCTGETAVGGTAERIQHLIPFSQFFPLLCQLLQLPGRLLIRLSAAVQFSEFSLLHPLLFFLLFQLTFRLCKIRCFFSFQLLSQPAHFLAALSELFFIGFQRFFPALQLCRFHACVLKILFRLKLLLASHRFISCPFFFFLLFENLTLSLYLFELPFFPVLFL